MGAPLFPVAGVRKRPLDGLSFPEWAAEKRHRATFVPRGGGGGDNGTGSDFCICSNMHRWTRIYDTTLTSCSLFTPGCATSSNICAKWRRYRAPS